MKAFEQANKVVQELSKATDRVWEEFIEDKKESDPVTISSSEYRELLKDKYRLEFIANAERTVATNKFLIQVLGLKGELSYTYFNHPNPNVQVEELASDRLTALRMTLDKAISLEYLKKIKGE